MPGSSWCKLPRKRARTLARTHACTHTHKHLKRLLKLPVDQNHARKDPCLYCVMVQVRVCESQLHLDHAAAIISSNTQSSPQTPHADMLRRRRGIVPVVVRTPLGVGRKLMCLRPRLDRPKLQPPHPERDNVPSESGPCRRWSQVMTIYTRVALG